MTPAGAAFLTAASLACSSPGATSDAGCDAPPFGVAASDTLGTHIIDLDVHPGGDLFVAAAHFGEAEEPAWGRRVSAASGAAWQDARVLSPDGVVAFGGTRVAVPGDGNPIYVWSDERNGNYDVFAQKLSAETGEPLWQADAIAWASLDFDLVQVAVGSELGAWVLTEPPQAGDTGFDEVWAAHIRDDGTVEPAGGSILARIVPKFLTLRARVLTRSNADLVLAWVDRPEDTMLSEGMPNYAFVQRFSPSGAPVWPEPVRFDETSGSRIVALADDGSDGAWLVQLITLDPAAPCNPVCEVLCTVDTSIIAQHLDPNGNRLLGSGDGVVVDQGPGLGFLPLRGPDGGVLVFGRDLPDPAVCARSSWARLVAADGTVGAQWPVAGSERITGDELRIASDGSFLFVALLEFLPGSLTVERFSMSGERTWGTGDEPGVFSDGTCPLANRQLMEIRADGRGGLWLAWQESSRAHPLIDMSWSLVTQHLDEQGIPTLFEEE